MMQRTKRLGLIRLAYLMPVINFVIFSFLFLLPRFFYTMSDVGATWSLFQMLDVTRAAAVHFFNGSTQGTTTDFYFYLVMMSFFALSLLCITLYGIFSVFTAIMTGYVWTPHAVPTVRGNNLKRAYRIAVPNRGFFVFFQLLPIFPSVYPYLFQIVSKRILGQQMKVFYYGIPDVIVVAVLAAASITLFFVTLSAQKENKMDLFRIYKIET